MPTWSSGLLRYIRSTPVTLAASAAHTDNTATTAVETQPGIATLKLNVTASSVPTSLDVVVQSSDDNTNFFTVGTFAQFTTGTGSRYVTCALSRYTKCLVTLVGTSYTFSIAGTTYGG